jgi:hypothetical protein
LRAFSRSFQKMRPGHEGLLRRHRQDTALLQGCEGWQQRPEARYCVQNQVPPGLLDNLQGGIPPRVDHGPRTGSCFPAAQFPTRDRYDPGDAGLKLPDLIREQLRVVAGGEPDHLETAGVRADDVESLPANAAGGT